MKIHHHLLPLDGTVFPFIFNLLSHSSADQTSLWGRREVLDCTTNTDLGLLSINALYRICTTPHSISFLHIRIPNICLWKASSLEIYWSISRSIGGTELVGGWLYPAILEGCSQYNDLQESKILVELNQAEKSQWQTLQAWWIDILNETGNDFAWVHLLFLLEDILSCFI